MIQTVIILIVSILFGASAQLFLKRGVLNLGSLDLSLNGFFSLVQRIFQNIWLIGGLFLFGISFVLWLFVLSRLKLSIAYPISTSLSFVSISLFSWLFLKEQLFPVQILGIFIILLGIFLLLKP